MIQYLNNIFLPKTTLWLILLLCFYYPFAASLITIFNLPSTIINITVRAVIILISILLVLFGILLKKSNFKLTYGQLFLIIFWVIYSVRIVFDLQNDVQFLGYNNSYVYGFAFGNILLPILAIIYWGNYINLKNIETILFAIFSISNLLIILSIYLKANTFDFTIFSQRLSLDSEANSEFGSVLNPITISYCGSLLTIITFYFILYKNFKFKLLLSFPLLLGIATLFIGASRGPLFTGIFTIILLIVSKYHRILQKKLFLIKVSLILIFSGVALPVIIPYIIPSEEIILVNRVNEFYEDRKTNESEERDFLIEGAINDFLDSPIIGKQFVLTYNNFYPHNIFVEVLMATGIVGAIFFLGFMVPLFKKCYYLFFDKKNEFFLLVIIFIPIIMGTLFSGSLFMSTDLWAWGTFLLSFKIGKEV